VADLDTQQHAIRLDPTTHAPPLALAIQHNHLLVLHGLLGHHVLVELRVELELVLLEIHAKL
jgi:hypothetical protein